MRDQDLDDPGLEEALNELSDALGRSPVPKSLEARVLSAIDQTIESERQRRGWSLVLLPAVCLATVALLAYGPMLTAGAFVGVPLLAATYGFVLRWLMDMQLPAAQ